MVPFVFVGGNANSPGWFSPVTGNVNDNVWRHFAWTLTPSGTWTVYINGVSVWTVTGWNYPAAITRGSNYLGKGNWGSDPYFTGAMADFRMYNSALGASGVAALYGK